MISSIVSLARIIVVRGHAKFYVSFRWNQKVERKTSPTTSIAALELSGTVAMACVVPEASILTSGPKKGLSNCFDKVRKPVFC
jgi:hypothetical protein